MNRVRKTGAIVNPRAADGKAGRRWPKIATLIEERLGTVPAWFTEAPGGGIELARELLLNNFDLIIVVGGDGTIHEVANGFIEFRQGGTLRPEACLGILPVGTGGDFRKSLDVPARLSEAMEILVSGEPALLDGGKAQFLGKDGRRAERYFVNLLSLGMGGEVALRARGAPRLLGGRAAFFWATLQVFLRYDGRRIRLRLDGAAEASRHVVLNIAVGNGRFHGGGMQPCPLAVLNDGLFDITVIDYLGALELARDVRYLYSGNIYRHSKVHHFRARTVHAESDQRVHIEVDGEPLGELPVEISLLPRCLPVMVARSSPLLASPPGAPF